MCRLVGLDVVSSSLPEAVVALGASVPAGTGVSTGTSVPTATSAPAGAADVLSGSPLAGQPAFLLLALVTVTGAGLGLLISLQAYQGYRQARSSRLLFLAVGVVLLTLVPFLLTVVAAVLAGATTLTNLSYPVALVTRTAEVLGLLAVLYSLQQG
jgi:D-alanyl-lipoteichoic acid acyltransferase DltB (MBOAT superfamily)